MSHQKHMNRAHDWVVNLRNRAAQLRNESGAARAEEMAGEIDNKIATLEYFMRLAEAASDGEIANAKDAE